MSEESVVVLAVQLHGALRFLVARMPLVGGAMTIIRTDSGRIPAFQSRDDALRSIERHERSEDNLMSLLSALADGWEMPVINLDSALQWSERPLAGRGDPRELALAWELLANADCAPPLMAFDPMGMYALEENRLRGTIDSADHAVAVAGMKLSGMLSEAERKGTAPGPVAWQAAGEFWTEADSATTSEVLLTGSGRFSELLVLT